MSNNINQQINKLLELSKTLSQKIDVDLKIVEALNEKMLKNATDEEKGMIEKMMAVSNKAMNFSKEGKQDEAITIIKEMQDECKSK